MKIRIGTRGSLLAITQTNLVDQKLKSLNSSISTEIITIETLGDRKQDTVEANLGDKKDWVYELEKALLDNKIDLAIHSGKDVPRNTEPGTDLLPVLSREDPFDIFIGKKVQGARIKFEDLKDDATIGTASLRRKASLYFYNPKLKLVDHRGNVPTRISKLDNSDTLSGIILAKAGILRLGILEESQYQTLDPSIMLPAMNQGILCAQFRSTDIKVQKVLKRLSTKLLKKIFFAERFVAERLEGDCKSAISIFAEPFNKNTISLSVRVMSQELNKQINLKEPISIEKESYLAQLEQFILKLIKMGAKELIESAN